MSRSHFVIEGLPPSEDRARWEAEVRRVLDWAGERSAYGLVDCFTDFELPPSASAALETLRAAAPEVRRPFRSSHRTFMAVRVNRDAALWSAFREFAPYSIHAEVMRSCGSSLLLISDGGDAVALELEESEVAELARILPGGAVVRRVSC